MRLIGKEKDIYYFARFVTVNFPFISSDGTIQQLKNSGGLRLIRKQFVVDSILRYDGAVKYIQYIDEKTQPIENTFSAVASEAFDSRQFKFSYAEILRKPTEPTRLLSSNPVVLNKISLQVRFEATAMERSITNARNLRIRAARLIDLLKKNYHLENSEEIKHSIAAVFI